VKNSALKTSLCVALLIVSFASSSQAVLVAVRDYTITTPVGRFGYQERRSTMAFGGDPRRGDPYFCFGPLGDAPALSVGVGACALFLVCLTYYFCRRRHENAAS